MEYDVHNKVTDPKEYCLKSSVPYIHKKITEK